MVLDVKRKEFKLKTVPVQCLYIYININNTVGFDSQTVLLEPSYDEVNTDEFGTFSARYD